MHVLRSDCRLHLDSEKQQHGDDGDSIRPGGLHLCSCACWSLSSGKLKFLLFYILLLVYNVNVSHV